MHYSNVYKVIPFRYMSIEDSDINETWLWTKAPVYFIQPPSIFQFTSLLFNHHNLSEQTRVLTVYLPSACCNTSATSCNGRDTHRTHVNNQYLDVLTNEVSCLHTVLQMKRGDLCKSSCMLVHAYSIISTAYIYMGHGK